MRQAAFMIYRLSSWVVEALCISVLGITIYNLLSHLLPGAVRIELLPTIVILLPCSLCWGAVFASLDWFGNRIVAWHFQRQPTGASISARVVIVACAHTLIILGAAFLFLADVFAEGNGVLPIIAGWIGLLAAPPLASMAIGMHQLARAQNATASVLERCPECGAALEALSAIIYKRHRERLNKATATVLALAMMGIIGMTIASIAHQQWTPTRVVESHSSGMTAGRMAQLAAADNTTSLSGLLPMGGDVDAAARLVVQYEVDARNQRARTTIGWPVTWLTLEVAKAEDRSERFSVGARISMANGTILFRVFAERLDEENRWYYIDLRGLAADALLLVVLLAMFHWLLRTLLWARTAHWLIRGRCGVCGYELEVTQSAARESATVAPDLAKGRAAL